MEVPPWLSFVVGTTPFLRLTSQSRSLKDDPKSFRRLSNLTGEAEKWWKGIAGQPKGTAVGDL